MENLRYSDFEKQINQHIPGIKKCVNCSNCEIGITGSNYAKCSAMYLSNSNGYQPKNKDDFKGFKEESAYISLLGEAFPNKSGDCMYYQRKWWRFWVQK